MDNKVKIQGNPLTAERFRAILERVGTLRAEGLTEETSHELHNLLKIVQTIQRQNKENQLRLAAQVQAQGVQAGPSIAIPSTPTPTPTPTANGSNLHSETNPLPPQLPDRPISPPLVTFSPEQLALLRCQILAFKLLSRNQPLTAEIHLALYSPVEALKLVKAKESTEATVSNVNGSGARAESVVEAAAASALAKEKAWADEPPLEEVEDPTSLVYPYNSFSHPLQILQLAQSVPGRRNLLIPTLLPAGLDPKAIAEERNRFIEARVQQRISELENLPSTISQETSAATTGHHSNSASITSQKIRALIQLKSLHLLHRQKALREDIVRGFNQASSLSLPTDRASFRRTKQLTLRDARLTEQLEQKQKLERERRAKQKHLDHLSAIVTHGRDLGAAHRAHQTKFAKIGKTLLKFHTDAEKDEQRRVERVSKERLKALRADDEEGYLKLIDTAKDTRITHLLRQTDAFLDSLASAVVAQQNDAKHDENPHAAAQAATAQAETEVEAMVVEGGDRVDESRFGAAPVFEEEVAADKVDYYNVAHKIKETITEQPKMLIGGQLKSYQIKGLEWMISLYNNHVNGILADEMGLGKTIQTISLITFLIETKKQNGPFLVIVPLSTMPNWIMEFEKWAPAVRMISYKGSPTQRKQSQNEIRAGGFQVLLTTYEYIIKDRPLLAKIKWIHMIIDEGHRMKNSQSKLSITLTTYYQSRYRLILTGTPLQNNLPELWALLNFVLPKIFGSVKSFDEWFNAPFANTGGQDKIEVNEEESLLVIRRLHKVLRPFLLRRLKKDVESDLPDKVERVIKCRMSSLQLKLTRQIKEHGMIFTDGPVDSKSKATGIKGLQNQIMQLRKICNHPFTFEQVERSIDPTGASDATLYRVAGKFEILDRILPKLFRCGHRVLMFFQMTTVMTIFEDYLNFRRIDHLRLDGTTKHEDRASLLKAFNEPNSKFPIFILSTRAGGLGLNLQTADTVIIFDSDWNPHQDLQAQDRAHRIGQKKEVRILRLVTERSVEEQVMAGASRKIEMDKKVIQAGRYDNKSTAEERDEYLRALMDGGDEEPEEDDELDEAEALNEAIARSEEERTLFTQMDKDRKEAEEYAWAAAGNKGKLPERLIQEHELPQVYQMEHASQVIQDEIFDDGARRARTQVTYDDGLSEEQWLVGLEETEEDVAALEKKRATRDRKIAKKQKMDDDSDSDNSHRGGDSDDDDTSNKRKRARPSHATSVTPSVADDDESHGGKRRKIQLSAVQESWRIICEQCFDVMEDLDNPVHGHQCSGLFNALPNKKDYADYYAIIRQPISLKEIKKKVNSGSYRSLVEFRDDVYLMLSNAMIYNEEGSIVYEDARLLKIAFDEVFERVAISKPDLA